MRTWALAAHPLGTGTGTAPWRAESSWTSTRTSHCRRRAVAVPSPFCATPTTGHAYISSVSATPTEHVSYRLRSSTATTRLRCRSPGFQTGVASRAVCVAAIERVAHRGDQVADLYVFVAVGIDGQAALERHLTEGDSDAGDQLVHRDRAVAAAVAAAHVTDRQRANGCERLVEAVVVGGGGLHRVDPSRRRGVEGELPGDVDARVVGGVHPAAVVQEDRRRAARQLHVAPRGKAGTGLSARRVDGAEGVRRFAEAHPAVDLFAGAQA